MAKDWTEDDISDQSGRVAVVTGANSGIGLDTARALARSGASVIMACRDLEKANIAAEHIKELDPAGIVVVMHLDLADLDSVRSFASLFRESYGRLDLLINNAGLGELPYGKTAQGFELHFGVNHLGHFALGGLLFDLLDSCEGSRIVTVSSLGHRAGSIHFEDLNWEGSYPPQLPYSQSKLANLLFTFELHRRLASAGRRTIAVAAHPGWCDTKMMQKSFYRILGSTFAQVPAMGALPSLYAATAPEVRGGEYFGPSGFMEFRGCPKKVGSSRRSRDEAVARRLWTVSENGLVARRDVSGDQGCSRLCAESRRFTGHQLLPASMAKREILLDASRRGLYSGSLQDARAVERAIIPVERIGGPIILVSGTDDKVWPSSMICTFVTERLARA